MMFAANLVISEFMASNSTGITDSAGDHADWIEIHNAGDADANLNDYFLTDSAGNPEEWRFPVQTLSAGGYLVVFASGRDLETAGSELDTNFKLSASGEYLALTNAADDSVAFAYSPTYPAQSSDVSYGLSDANDPNSTQVYFSSPTPGAANNPTTAEPTYSVTGKNFTGSLQVSLTDTTPGAVIHYTVNGATPTASSPTYAGTLTLTNTTMLRTLATASGFTSSPVTSQSYIALDATANTTATLGSSSVSTFTSNLPIVMIDTFGSTVNDSTDAPVSVSFVNTTSGTASALGTPDFDGRAGLRIRGSTSESYPKKQYNLELWDETNNDKNASLLGLPSDSDWVLYAPYTEQIMMQNALAYQWSNEMGEYASRTQYVEVFMNTSSVTAGGQASPTTGADYVGIYILEEKIKIDSNRVDVDKLSSTNPAGGFIVAQDRYSGQDYFTTPQGVHMVLKDPDDTSLTSTISGEWDNFENALFTGSAGAGQPWDTPGNAAYYGNYINIQSFVDDYLLNEMTRNIDAFWLSAYYTMGDGTLNTDGSVTQGKISAGPDWDYNLSLGAPDYQFGSNSDGWDTNTLSPAPGAAGVSGFNPQDAYLQRLLTDPNFDQAVADRWEQLRSTVFTTPKLMADIDANVSILANGTTNYPVGSAPTQPATDPIVRNFIRWPELGTAVTTDGDYDPAGSWIQDVNIAKNWLTARVNWMDSQFVPPPTLTSGGTFTSPTTVTMTGIGAATTADTTLIGPNSTVYYKFPTANITNWQTLSATSLPSGWTQGTTGLGYDTTTTGTGAISFLPYITTNVQAAMYKKDATVYTLMNFTVSDPTQIQALILKAYYDDGFIAWVNGVRVMDANSPENTTAPGYTTVAAGSGDDTLAITNREFDITSVKSLLHAGNNTLAIQGLNSGTGSEDFLLDPTLYARTYSYPTAGQVYYTTDGSDPRTSSGAVSASAKSYTTAVTLNSSTKILARTLTNGVWSALASQVYDLDANRLRITEMMYNPPALSGYSTQDLEFIEVQNISAAPLDLTGFDFTNGVTFAFPSQTLAPGAYGVIVKNPAAFAARYGNSPNVLGTYTGSLDNSGETVTLTDGLGVTVETFKYSPTWYSATAGNGASLVVANPGVDTSNLSTANGWRASQAADGAPGYADSDSAAPAVTSWIVAENGAGNSPTVKLNFSTVVSVASSGNLSAVNTVTGATASILSHVIDGSTITYAFAPGTPSGDYLLTLPAAAVFNVSGVTASANQTLNLLLVRAGDTYVLPATMTVGQLVAGLGGTLDIAGNSLTITSPTSLAAIRSLLATGYASGAWNGVGGIISSAAAASPSSIGIAYILNSTNGSILLRPSLIGDANVDGKTNGLDTRQIYTSGSFNDGLHTHDWSTGDVNYDGVVNGLDTRLIYTSGNFNNPAQTLALLTSDTATDTTSIAATTPAATVASTPPTVATPVTPTAVAPAAVAPARAVITPAPAALVTPVFKSVSTVTASAKATPFAVAAASASTALVSVPVETVAPRTAKKHRLAPFRRIAVQRRRAAARS